MGNLWDQDTSSANVTKSSQSSCHFFHVPRYVRPPFGNRNLAERSQAFHPQSADSIQGLGTPDHPFMYFRGGAEWIRLDHETMHLALDLFRPIGQDNDGILDIEELRPICTFRNLRILKVTGMMQSYQKYIWQTAWLNQNLEELELEMVLEPCLRKSLGGLWPFIKGGWRLRETQYDNPVYYGDNGTGILNRRIGIGEYLDKHVIERAKLRAMAQGPTSSHLTIRYLTLTGFVVDADPFLLWFDPAILRRIIFKDNCVDAGFYLPATMRGRVTVVYPRQAQESVIVIPARRVVLKQELKTIDLRGGRKVAETAYAKQKQGGNPIQKETKHREWVVRSK